MIKLGYYITIMLKMNAFVSPVSSVYIATDKSGSDIICF